ncbi:MAG: carboxypeptidase regulatory-like domain-containing protein [Microbacteriaceae bacterium]
MGSPAVAHATDATAAITGKVVDAADGTRIAGVTVFARSTSGRTASTVTNSRGEFYLTGLRSGTYAVKFTDKTGLIQADGSSERFHYTTEWLGDSVSRSTSDTITLSSGEKHSGVRELIGTGSRATGRVYIDGRPATVADGVRIRIAYGDKQTVIRAAPTFTLNGVHADNYRIRVVSATGSFDPVYVVDPRDGNTVFHLNGVDKVTGLRADITTSS